MTIVSVQFLSVHEAEDYVPAEPTVAISIISPGRPDASLHASMADVLRQYFHDTTPKDHNAAGTVVFSTEQAQQIVGFIRTHHAEPEPRHLLIHCEAGISRSAAVAVFAASECRVPLSGQFAFLNPWVLTRLVDAAYPHYAFDE